MNHTENICVFCNPEADRVFFRAHTFYCLWSKFEVSDGHALVIPTDHVATIFDADYELARNLMIDGIDIARRACLDAVELGRLAPIDGWNVGVNIGPAGGQTVMHAHVHLIPRRIGDVPDPRGGVRNVIPARGNYMLRSNLGTAKP